MDNKLRAGDFVICAMVLCLAGLFAIPFFFRSSDHLSCEIKQNNRIVKVIALSEGYRDTVTLTQSDITNIIEIDGTQVRFRTSTCPDQVCVRTGVLTHAGQMAVCLPTQVSVRILGTDAPVDAIAT